MQSYYNTAPQGQMKGIVTRPNVGLNEYTPEIAITDNHMSDMLDADVYRDEAMVLSSVDSITGGYVYGKENTDGIVHAGIALPYAGFNSYALLVQNKTSKNWFIRKVFTDSQTVYSSQIVQSLFPEDNMVINGNFDDLTAFTNNIQWNYTNCALPVIVDNKASFKATAQNGGISYPKGATEISIETAKKYYVGVKMLTPAANSTVVKITLFNGTGADVVTTLAFATIPTSSSIHIFSEVITTASDHTNMKIECLDSRASAWTTIDVYYAVVVDVTDETISDSDIIIKYDALGFIPNDTPTELLHYGVCNFSLEAKKYTCFTCSVSKKLIYYDADNDFSNTYVNIPVDLPFYPKKIVSHANRIFALDMSNKLWWCRAGDLFSWYSNEYNATMLATSQNMKATAYTLTGVIDTPRPITATITIVADQDTYGSLVITGTNALDESQTETIALFPGRNQSLKSFKTITTVITSGWVTGGTADTIEFGVAPVSGGFVQADAGYWTFEREKTLTDLCVMSDNLYVFAPDNIYVFRGYSYDTFSLSLLIANIGIKDSANFCNWLTTINNTSYFVDNGDIYEFNGSSYPKLISHSETVNGNISNGMYGGVEPIPTTFSLASDNDHLYVYNSTIVLHDDNRYYIYNTQSKSWWHMTGFSKNNSNLSVAFKVKYLTLDSTDGMISVISSNTTEGVFDLYGVMGHKGLYSPFIVTKAFNSNPSELGTLTSIILQVRGTTTETSSIILSYSLTSSANDFKEFKRFANYVFNGDIENLDIPVPVACIANAHHYRIKIECTGYTEIYNIERRFRMRGRTR